MRRLRNLGAIILAAMTILVSAGCSNNTKTESTPSGSTESTSSGTTIAKPYDDTPEQISAIKNAVIGDTIAFNEYCVFVQSDGTKVYFADGAYAFVYNSIVVETRKAVNVADSNATIDEILALDDDFKHKSELSYYFYNSDNQPVSYSGTNRLTAEIPYCLVEYVDWSDDKKTQGKYYSYAFSYGDAPVKITSVYIAKDKDNDESSSTSGESSSTSGESSSSDSSSAESTDSKAE